MKKTILTVATLALVAAGVQNARAGDREWAVAGKVLTGVVAASVITHALAPRPVYSYSYAPAYSYPPPAPQIVYQAPPAPVYVAPPAPVYVAPPRPVIVYRQPVYVAPAPVIGFRVGVGVGFRHRHGCW